MRVVFNNYWVTNVADDGLGSLRAAVVAANMHAGDDSVSFKSNIAGTIGLTHELEISGNTEIDGNGKVSVSGQDTTRVLKIDAGAKVEVNHLTITHGKTSDALGGGGVLNLGELKLKQSIVTGNTAMGTANVFPVPNVGGNGGGINNVGKLTIEESEVSNNTATFFGGGIQNTGTAAIEDSKISSNSSGKEGGGIQNAKIASSAASTGKLTIEESLIADNTVSGDGAGIRNERDSVLTIEKSIISGNIAVGPRLNGGTGGLGSAGDLTIRESLITKNIGTVGGIYLGYATSNALISHSIISYNHNSSGGFGGAGGIGSASRKPVVVEDSAIQNNEGRGTGGVFIYDFLTLAPFKISRSTISGNVGGGVGGASGDRIELVQSTVDGNRGGSVGGLRGGSLVDSSTISNNVATPKSGSAAGGVSGTPKLINSTISGNVVDAKDLKGANLASTFLTGGILAGYDLNFPSNKDLNVSLENTTVAFNKAINAPGKNTAHSAGGILGTSYHYSGSYGYYPETQFDANIKVRNTIIARNEVNTTPDDVAGIFVSSGHNLIGVVTPDATGFVASDLKGTPATPLDPRLGSLAYNGGPTKTHLPQNNSPVRDAGDSSGATTTDQRGYSRIAGAAIDIGAVESRSRPVGSETEHHDSVFDDWDEEDWLKKLTHNLDELRHHD